MLALLLLALLVAVSGPRGASAASTPCGATTGDRAAVATVLAESAADCSCLEEGHARYVKCAASVIKGAVRDGRLPQQCKGRARKGVARSTCGHDGAVTCCQTTKLGKSKCVVKAIAEKCKAPQGGSAHVGSSRTCDDACLGSCTDTAPSAERIDAATSVAVMNVDNPWSDGLGLVVARAVAELECTAPEPACRFSRPFPP